MATSGSAYAISVGIYTLALFFIFCAFSIWRRTKATRKFYAPKRYQTEEGYGKPPPLGASLLGWVPAVMKLNEAEVILTAGVDAALYMRFLRMSWIAFALISFFVLTVLLPINITNNTVDQLMATEGNSSSNNYYFTNLDKTTISNIANKSSRLIAHAIIAWVVTIVVLVLLWQTCKEALRLRIFYLLNVPPGAESHSILCTDIPGMVSATTSEPKPQNRSLSKNRSASKSAIEAAATLSSMATPVDETTGRWEIQDRWAQAVRAIQDFGGSMDAMVDSEFKRIYGPDYACAHLIYDTSALDKLVAEYQSTAKAAEDLIDDYISKKRRGKELKPAVKTVNGVLLGAWGREKYGLKPAKVDAFEFFVDRLSYLKEEIEEARTQAKGKHKPAAFVTFKRRTAQVVAADALMCEDLSTWICQAAPRPAEIVWPNVGMRARERSVRGRLMWAAFITLALFYLIPVAAVQALLATNVSVSFIQDIPIINSIITAILPGLALAIFMALLPSIITAMNRYAGMLSLSEIDMGLLTRFFIFQVFTVFFGSFIAGTVANQFSELIHNPSSVVTLLGSAAPQTSIFFLTYVTLQGLFLIPFSILRLVPFVIFWVLSKFLASTERAKARLWQDQWFSYGTYVVNDTIMALLGVTFCCICPIIAPATLVYFSTAYIVAKYNCVYVYKQPYQAGGMAWQYIFYQVITGLYIFQVVMICLLAIKESIAAPIICAPLLVITFFFMVAARAQFWRPMVALSSMAAAEIDAQESARKDLETTALIGGSSEEETLQRYLSPSFKSFDAAHEELLSDCKRMKAVLDGGSDNHLFERQASTVEGQDDDDGVMDVPVPQESTSSAAV